MKVCFFSRKPECVMLEEEVKRIERIKLLNVKLTKTY